MFRLRLALLAATAMTAIGAAASAQESRWYVHMGPAQMALDEAATMTAGGQPIPGADISIDPQLTVALELGYFVTPHIAVSFTGGVPPDAQIEAAGTLAGAGRIGEINYGPATLTAHYHLGRGERFSPYIGGGVAYMYVFDTTDGLLAGLEVDNTVGLAFQAGADLALNEKWGLFIDYKKAFLQTESRGSLGGAPVVADTQVDPSVLHGGLSFRF
jgi:outer membrane protein